jgi:hypothetical protein
MGEGFSKNQRGAMIEKVAIVTGLLALASLFLGSEIEQMALNGGLPTIAFLSADQYVATKGKSPNFDAIDYTATGSINGRIVLDPCTGRQKSP